VPCHCCPTLTCGANVALTCRRERARRNCHARDLRHARAAWHGIIFEKYIGVEQWPNQTGKLPKFIVLGKDPSEADLLKLREDGMAPTSSTALVATCNGLLPVRHDAHLLAPDGMTCTLKAFFSALAATPEGLGVSCDPIVGLNNPVGFRALSTLLHRSWAAPAGALQLLRVVDVKGWDIIRIAEGLYLFVVYLRRHGVFHLHCVGWNAGASVLYLGPGVVVVTEDDKHHLDLFAARMALEFGIYLPRDGVFRCRQIYFNPKHPCALQLQCNVPEQVQQLQGEVSASAQRRRTSQRPRKRGKKRKRADYD
jgi:hypothetical protein